jgi:hypothetical protein
MFKRTDYMVITRAEKIHLFFKGVEYYRAKIEAELKK